MCIRDSISTSVEYLFDILHLQHNFIEVSHSDNHFLEQKIKELNSNLLEKDRIIENFKKEMLVANQRLESLISQISRHYKLLQKLQYKLIPTELPSITGFSFSHQFVPSYINGGDYFDIYNKPKSLKFGIFISSCSGHSASALLLSVLLKNSEMLDNTKSASSKKILAQILNELKPQLANSDRISLLYATIDRRTLKAKFCRLGHCLGYILRGSEIIPLESNVSEFHQEFDEEVDEKAVSLEPKDGLVFISAGLVKVKNLEGEEFGVERLNQAIMRSDKGVHEIKNALFMAVKKHSQGTELQQDMTIVVSFVKDNVLKLA